MAQPHLLYSLRDPFPLLPVQSYRATRLHGEKATTARADTPQDHECGRSMAPAFPNIWAACLLANCVQFLATHQILQIFVIFALRRPHPQPFGSALWNHARHLVFLSLLHAYFTSITLHLPTHRL